MDLATASEDEPLALENITAFRITRWTEYWLSGMKPEGLPSEDEKLLANSGARLHVPRLVPRAVRYQLARFCEWEGTDGDAYLYQLTPMSLERARQQGLLVKHLLALLRRHTSLVPLITDSDKLNPNTTLWVN